MTLIAEQAAELDFTGRPGSDVSGNPPRFDCPPRRPFSCEAQHRTGKRTGPMALGRGTDVRVAEPALLLACCYEKRADIHEVFPSFRLHSHLLEIAARRNAIWHSFALARFRAEFEMSFFLRKHDESEQTRSQNSCKMWSVWIQRELR